MLNKHRWVITEYTSTLEPPFPLSPINRSHILISSDCFVLVFSYQVMDLEEIKISMTTRISISDYKKGRLGLALPFYCEYGKCLPGKVKLHVKTGIVWEGKYVRGSFYLEDLEDMMVYYSLKPYHFAVLHYVGDGHFNIQFYTPYAVEMKYPLDNQVAELDNQCTDLEEDKLSTAFHYNAVSNFLGVYNLIIKSKHLQYNKNTKVLSENACYELRLTESVNFIWLSFEDHEWKIRFTWINGQALFGTKWFEFVNDASIVVGDILALYKTEQKFKFKVCVFDRKTVADEALGRDVLGMSSNASFFKVMDLHSMADGELELPLLFSKSCGQTIGDVVNIELGAGYTTKFKYCSVSKKIYGLNRFLAKYDIHRDYMIFFKYLGNSCFAISVYDSQFMDHFRDDDGYLRFDDFINPSHDMELVLVSSDSEDNVAGFIDMSAMQLSNDNSETELDNEIVLGNDGHNFTLTIKKSHIDQNCHGMSNMAYMSNLEKKNAGDFNS